MSCSYWDGAVAYDTCTAECRAELLLDDASRRAGWERLVLVLLTARSIPSIDVLREVTLAADEKIPLLPVRYFFVAGQRLELARLTQADQVRSIVPAVARSMP